MQGIVVTIGSLFACREVVPAVRKTDTIVVAQVQIKTQLSACPGEELGESITALQPGILIDGWVANISIAGTVHDTHNRQAQLAVCSQPMVRHGAVEGKIIFQHSCSAKVAK